MVTVDLVYDMYVLSVTIEDPNEDIDDDGVDDSELISAAVEQAISDWGRAAGDFDHAVVR